MPGRQELAVNDRGEACFFYEDPRPALPVSAHYAVEARRLSFDLGGGTRETVVDRLDPALAEYLVSAERLLLCRVVDGAPVEGHDIRLEIDHEA